MSANVPCTGQEFAFSAVPQMLTRKRTLRLKIPAPGAAELPPVTSFAEVNTDG